MMRVETIEAKMQRGKENVSESVFNSFLAKLFLTWKKLTSGRNWMSGGRRRSEATYNSSASNDALSKNWLGSHNNWHVVSRLLWTFTTFNKLWTHREIVSIQLISICRFSLRYFQVINFHSYSNISRYCIAKIPRRCLFSVPFSINYVKCTKNYFTHMCLFCSAGLWVANSTKTMTVIIFQKNGFANVNSHSLAAKFIAVFRLLEFLFYITLHCIFGFSFLLSSVFSAFKVLQEEFAFFGQCLIIATQCFGTNLKAETLLARSKSSKQRKISALVCKNYGSANDVR